MTLTDQELTQLHVDALRMSKDDPTISYGEARERIAAKIQLRDVSNLEDHFVALLRIRAVGVTQRSSDFAAKYLHALTAIRRERVQVTTIATPAPRLVAAPAMPQRRPPVATSSRVEARDVGGGVPRELTAAVQILRTVKSHPLTEQQTTAYQTFISYKPMTFTGGYALVSGIADLANRKDKAAAIAGIQAAADVILASAYGGHAA